MTQDLSIGTNTKGGHQFVRSEMGRKICVYGQIQKRGTR